MHGFKKLALFVSALLPFSSGLPQAANTPAAPAEFSEVVPNKYIVTLKDTVSDVGSHLTWVEGIHARSLGRRELGLAGVEEAYNVLDFKGYSGAFDTATVQKIKASPQVEAVEQDEIWYSFGTTTERNVPSWGLSAISSRKGGDGKWRGGGNYIHNDKAGEGTYAYVLDTGIYEKHWEFHNQIDKIHNIYAGYPVENTDLHGHGTHVAGIIAGRDIGVAPKAKIVAVKVFADKKDKDGNAQTTKCTAIAGYLWAMKDIIQNKRQGISVINLSLGGASTHQSYAWNKTVTKAWESGIFSVMAAGNERQPVSQVNPANAHYAFTVAATKPNNQVWKDSNYGPEVNILAPGEVITSAGIMGFKEYAVKSGTSMAAPHVAGVALNLMSMGVNKPADIKRTIEELATKNLIKGLTSLCTLCNGRTPNRFLYNNEGLPYQLPK